MCLVQGGRQTRPSQGRAQVFVVRQLLVSRPGPIDEASVRTAAERILRSAFADLVSVNQWGSVVIAFPVTPVVCRVRGSDDGPTVLDVSSPILLDFTPPADFYELVAVSQIGLKFGAITTAAGEGPGQIMLELRAQLLTDPLDPGHLVTATRLVHGQAVAQIEGLERITPPLGGARAYGPPVDASAPTPAGPDRLPARELVRRLAEACSEVMRLQGECFEKGELVRRAQYVVAQPQAPASRANLSRVADRYQEEFNALLSQLTDAVETGRELWHTFMARFGAPGRSVDKILMPLATEGIVQGDELSKIMIGGVFLMADFGSTLDSFFEADSRLAGALKSTGVG